MATKLTFYGGVNEIGGNKILVQSENGSVFLDFGRRMGYASAYFSEFLQVRSKNALRDLIRLNVLPKIDGIYTPHLVDMTLLFDGSEVNGKVPVDQAPDYWKMADILSCNPNSPAVDGVFVSHAHFDHIQDVSFLDCSIPVYCTEKTKTLAKAMTDVSASGVDDQYYKIAKKIIIKTKAPSYRTLCPGECEYSEEKEKEKPIIVDPKTKFVFTHEVTPQYRSFITRPQGQIKGIKYKMIPVGHSVPGACSVLLGLPSEKSVLYTGDVRFHGKDEVSIDDYVSSIGCQVDVMITEGTRVGHEEILTEDQIGQKISSEIKHAAGLILVNFGWKDLARFKTVYEAAKDNDRTLVICPKLAYLLYEMHVNFPDEYADPRRLPNLKVYLKREGDLLYSRADYDKFKMGYLHHHGRNSQQSDRNIVRIAERLGIGGNPKNPKNPLPLTSQNEPYDYKDLYTLAMHHFENGIRSYRIRENPRLYVLMFSYWDANELFDLIPHNNPDHKTLYICASTEPFNEEMEIDETKFINWLDYFGVRYECEVKDEQKIFARRHVSGHASKTELKELIEKINPTTIIPIHTTNTELFSDIFKGKIILPEYAKPIEI